VTTIERNNRLNPTMSMRPIGTRTLIASHLWWVLPIVAAVVYSVLYLDRPVFRFSESLFGRFAWTGNFTDAPSFFHPLALLLFGLFGEPDLACLLGDASPSSLISSLAG
jgi:hypothetical protein